MSKNPHGLKVGQELFYVSYRGSNFTTPVTVEKVGNKWAEIKNRTRISLETLICDGGQYSPSGRCYLSEQDYRDELEQEALTRAIHKATEWRVRYPLQKLREVARILEVNHE